MAARRFIGGAAEDEALAVGGGEDGEARAPDQRPRQVAEDDEGHQRHDQPFAPGAGLSGSATR